MATGSVTSYEVHDESSADHQAEEIRTEVQPPASPQGMSGTTAALVEVRNLKKSFGEHVAVADVSFSLKSGEILGLLGPNGAGKSTIMMMIAGLLSPTSGEILLNGTKFERRNRELRRMLGVVPQEYAMYQELSAVENLTFFGKIYGLQGEALKSRRDEVLEQIGLVESAGRRAGTYSGGMKRRLNFGLALMHKPHILILDEPTVGVDPQSRSHLLDCVRQLAGEGVGIIYASHYMEEVEAICQRVAIIDHGELVASDTIPRLLSGLAADLHLYVDQTTGIGDQLGDLAQVGTGTDGEPVVIVSMDQPQHQGRAEPLRRFGADSLAPDASNPPPDLVWRLQATLYKLGTLGIRVNRVETQQTNLERLFLQLTGKRLRD
jgi:ABC-2 type transport system ATP-binding protein